MGVSSVGIVPATSSDLTIAFKRAADSSETTLSQSEKEAIIVVILGILLSLKGSLTEKIIEDTTDEEIRGILKPVQSELQATYFSWFVIPSNVRQALLAEFKRRKKEEEEKKQREKKQKEVKEQQDKLGTTVLGRIYDTAKYANQSRQSHTEMRRNKMGKKFAINSAKGTDKYYYYDSFDGEPPKINLTGDELLKIVRGNLNRPDEYASTLDDIWDIEWDMIGGDFEGVTYGPMSDFGAFLSDHEDDDWYEDFKSYQKPSKSPKKEKQGSAAEEKVYNIVMSFSSKPGWVVEKDHPAYPECIYNAPPVDGVTGFFNRPYFQVRGWEGELNVSYAIIVEGRAKWDAIIYNKDATAEAVQAVFDEWKAVSDKNLTSDEYKALVGKIKSISGGKYLSSSKENNMKTIKSAKRLGFFNENTVVYDDGSTEVYRQGAGWTPGESVKELDKLTGFEGILDWFNEQKGQVAASKRRLSSARGEVTDSTRQLVRDILAQVPSLVKVPERQQGIKKEPYGPDHVCYFYSEEGPRKGSFVTVEFHVDPSDLYTDIFVTTRASFAAAADGGEARQDEREITLDEFVIEDLEDYSLADIDKIDAAVEKGFEGAQKFDEQAASTLASRKALFSSKHKRFVKSGKTRIASSLENEVDHWVNTVGCISEMPEDERSDLQAVADHVASKIEDVESLGYSDDPEDSVRLVNDVADIIQKKGWLVSSGKIASDIPGLERYIQELMDEEGLTREEAEAEARERISIGCGKRRISSKADFDTEGTDYYKTPEGTYPITDGINNILLGYYDPNKQALCLFKGDYTIVSAEDVGEDSENLDSLVKQSVPESAKDSGTVFERYDGGEYIWWRFDDVTETPMSEEDFKSKFVTAEDSEYEGRVAGTYTNDSYDWWTDYSGTDWIDRAMQAE